MRTVIYLDVLLLVNFVVGAAFLLAAGLLCGACCSPLRLVGGAGAAADPARRSDNVRRPSSSVWPRDAAKNLQIVETQVHSSHCIVICPAAPPFPR